eukprot:scaffold8111_cov206-Skeletonema_marinoi.AAC.14
MVLHIFYVTLSSKSGTTLKPRDELETLMLSIFECRNVVDSDATDRKMPPAVGLPPLLLSLDAPTTYTQECHENPKTTISGPAAAVALQLPHDVTGSTQQQQPPQRMTLIKIIFINEYNVF